MDGPADASPPVTDAVRVQILPVRQLSAWARTYQPHFPSRP